MDPDITTNDASRICEDDEMRHVRCCAQTAVDGPIDTLVTFDYLNKGAANVIFKIEPWSEAPSTPPFLFVDPLRLQDPAHTATLVDRQHLMGRVLRVPRGGPKHLTSLEIIHGFEHAVRPLFLPGTYEMVAEAPMSRLASCTTITVQLNRDFSNHLMEHEAVLLLPDVMKRLYTRVEKGTFVNTLPRKCWGILLPDMSPSQGRSITLEIKPKWLVRPCSSTR